MLKSITVNVYAFKSITVFMLKPITVNVYAFKSITVFKFHSISVYDTTMEANLNKIELKT